MGQLISWLTHKEPQAAIIDFENVQPTADEMEIWNEVRTVLDQCPVVLRNLQSYNDTNGDVIRAALQQNTDDARDRALEAIGPSIKLVKQFYEFSKQIDRIVEMLLRKLSENADSRSLQGLQAIVKQLADTFDFILEFDGAKMSKPAIQNEFSFFRRLISRDPSTGARMGLTDRDAYPISMFLAQGAPLMHSVAEHVGQADPHQQFAGPLAAMANSCRHMLSSHRFENERTNNLCLRCMTASIVLFDFIVPAGAFHKRGLIHIVECLKLLKTYTPAPTSLVNAIKYTSRTYKQPATASSIKNILG
eukprot:gnl/Trimastix_PCT/1695.p1 GENE.gnl/Trimastix_PCT/1695~~gnl/Trimastix_PCT/1695.p1  ORF type:complete len:305 (+),score=57.36 gnl/Trimastix_PCT/1695:82-996(+)